jgi:hypothetical protein
MARIVKSIATLVVLVVTLGVWSPAGAQSITGSFSGVVTDERQAVIPNATVTARNTETNITRTVQTDDEGRYRLQNLPVGAYEITVEAGGFAKYVRTGLTLALNQNAVVDVPLKPTGFTEVVTVTENASLLNTSNAEVGVRFDSRRIAELPLTTNRNVYNIALSAAGVSQLGFGQSNFSGGGVGSTSGVSYSANGGRVRSNNFLVDGQDNNDTNLGGAQQPLNNPDLIQEVRLITNQFNAEYGRNPSSVFNAITKAGTNEYHGSLFWFHNDNKLNALSNLDKAAGRTRAPFRIENQFGGTFGGPVVLPRFGQGGPATYRGTDRTFFFFSGQRWFDRQLGSGSTIRGVPTEAGRQILQSAVGSRAQVAALLRFLPAAQGVCSPACNPATFTANGQTFSVPLGTLTGSTAGAYDDWQWSGRIDHKLSENNQLSGRYLFQDGLQSGAGQATPPGNTQNTDQRTQSLNITLNSVISPRLVNELRLGYARFAQVTNAQDPTSQEIPAIEIFELGLNEFNSGVRRTGIGLAANLPQFSFRNGYQIQDNLAFTTGGHSMKYGVDIFRRQLKSFFFPISRGRLAYTTLDRFVNDIANVATINRPLAGGVDVFYYQWHDFFAYAQDEWKVTPSFTLSFGLRYETPGQPISDLVDVNTRIVAAAGGNQGFAFTPVPKRDKDNWQPRFGFNWNPKTDGGGVLGFLTGGDKLVLRGGYARAHDYSFTNIASNIQSAFPFVASVALPTTPQTVGDAGVSNAFVRVPQIQGATGLNPNTLQRTVVASDFRSPVYDSFSLEVQRELSNNVVMRVGYVATKGNALFQTVDGNPRDPNRPGCNQTPPGVTPIDTCRIDPTRTFFRLRANVGQSIYHSMQASLDKRLSRGFSAGLHYTWSMFIDTASEIFNASNGEVAVAQNPFNLRADRARSSYDRPHRLSGNIVYELPFLQEQKGFVGKLFGGWQANAFFTFQSGAPFTPLNGEDPGRVLEGIDNFVGSAIRPNIYTNLDVSRMSIEELFVIDQQLRAQARTQAQQIFAGLTNPQVGALPGTLPNTLFTVSQGRIVRNANGTLGVVVDFRGLPNAAARIGNAGRNILRADGIGNVDFGLLKNVRLNERHNFQIRADFYNLTNTRNFGIPTSAVNSAAFLNQWGTDGGNRRIIVGLRYAF